MTVALGMEHSSDFVRLDVNVLDNRGVFLKFWVWW